MGGAIRLGGSNSDCCGGEQAVLCGLGPAEEAADEEISKKKRSGKGQKKYYRRDGEKRRTGRWYVISG